jgi:cytochrome P450
MQHEVLAELLRDFDQKVRLGPVDAYREMMGFTLRLVGRSLLGRRITDAELDQIGATISAIQGFIIGQVVQPYTVPWTWISGQHAKYQRLRVEGDAIVRRHVKARLAQGGTDGDLLRVLMETPYHDTGEPMSHEMVLIETIQLLVAGNETSSVALTWVLTLLARHPESVADIRDEVAAVVGDTDVDARHLHHLSVTMRAINEALRLFPPFWTIDRVSLGDDEIAGVRIPAGIMLLPYIYGAHRNPDHWEQVERYDPRRFEPDRSRGRHPFAFIPFGAGPRICIGNNMAIMQIVLIVVALVRRYDFHLVDPDAVRMRPQMLSKPDGAVAMVFRPRS